MFLGSLDLSAASKASLVDDDEEVEEVEFELEEEDGGARELIDLEIDAR